MDFKILLEKITPALKAIAKRHVLKGFHDTEDLYQEMCIYLWNNYRNGLPIGINESYVIKGCEFHILNFQRKGGKKPLFTSLDMPLDSDGNTLKDVLADERHPLFDKADSSITIKDIKTKDLDGREKKVFGLLVKGYTVREAAERIGISHVMVVKIKKKIIEKLKKRGYQR
jgi:RNA polymerase sigma factor (sigma-70 family)